MPSMREMQRFRKNNPGRVARYKEAIAAEAVSSQIADEITSTPRLIGESDITTFAVLVAMGYGSPRAREIIQVQYTIDLLES